MALNSQTIVTRFAPSPTGYLHVGGARTALFSWLLARHHGGRFLLRIEDTDLARSTEQAAEQLLEDLRWLGLHWDNAELVYQSRRLDVYNRIIGRLIDSGHAYKAYETEEEIAAARKTQGLQYRYTRPALSAGQIAQYESEGRKHVVRFAMPVRPYKFDDIVLGPGQGIDEGEVQDFIIRKGDGMPTFHFAVVVDDHEMGVTHVLRGQEHLLNTCKHVALMEALGYARPAFGHLPLIQNLDGSKMGKRDRDKKVREAAENWLKNTKKPASELAALSHLEAARIEEWIRNKKSQLDPVDQQKVMHVVGLRESDLPEVLVHDFRKNGYLPEALLNFLALLGWNPGGDKERMTMGEMTTLFDVARIGKSNSKFDRAKLASFNTQAAEEAPPDRLVPAFRDYLSVNPQSPLNRADDGDLDKLLRMKKGFRLLRDVDEASRFFYVPTSEIVYDATAVEKVLKKAGGLSVLREVKDVLSSAAGWTAHALESAVKVYCESKSLGLGKVAQPLRVAISGSTVSPPIFESLEFLGKERTMTRIERCLREHA